MIFLKFPRCVFVNCNRPKTVIIRVTIYDGWSDERRRFETNQKEGGENIFIDEFYYGNIDAQKSNLMKEKLFKKTMDLLAESEKELLEKLKGDELSLFQSFSDAWSYVNSETNKESFKIGFRLGAQCVIDVFED